MLYRVDQMAKRRGKRPKQHPTDEGSRRRPRARASLEREYRDVCNLAAHGQHAQASRMYEILDGKIDDAHLKALIANDLAALKAMAGDTDLARKGFETALALDDNCKPARANLAVLMQNSQSLNPSAGTAVTDETLSRVRGQHTAHANRGTVASGHAVVPSSAQQPSGSIKVAILSFLFNWPSTGGGIVHTVELAQFLRRAGYEVKHFYAQHLPWGVGKVEGALPFPSEALEFNATTWNIPRIQDRFRMAVSSFRPDYVIVTDSWNSKPILAEAVREYPYFLRFQAMECLCPLNNVRLLPDGGGQFRQCQLHQLATPEECCRCLRDFGRFSGSLHQAERELCEVGTRGYYERLVRAIADAEAVLVVNPLMAAMISPYAKCVKVVTAGMDPARFPWPWPEGEVGSQQSAVGSRDKHGNRKTQLLFAGLVEEPMKGYEVLHRACAILWQRRRDFELVATGEPAGQIDEFTRFLGWQSQAKLPRYLRAADIYVFPTIAQEALGRTAVEAMAVGRPVVASRIGGLPYTVADGATGLLCEPGNPQDLAAKIEMLLDDPALRDRMGLAGRRRFEEHYTWDVIIE
jgi:glycosyltransferase involved in cell wall biosynthesis